MPHYADQLRPTSKTLRCLVSLFSCSSQTPFVWFVLPHNALVLVFLLLTYLICDCAYGHCVERKEEERDGVQCARMSERLSARGTRDIYVKVSPSMRMDSESAKYTEVTAFRTFFYGSLRHGNGITDYISSELDRHVEHALPNFKAQPCSSISLKTTTHAHPPAPRTASSSRS
jgi:hypothetical protein